MIEWDPKHRQWVARLRGSGRPTLRCRSKRVLEQMLDDLEQQQCVTEKLKSQEAVQNRKPVSALISQVKRRVIARTQ
jgi:hypothetical protein